MISSPISMAGRTAPGRSSRHAPTPGEKVLALGIVFFVLIPAALTFMALERFGLKGWRLAAHLNFRPTLAHFRWARYLAWIKLARPELKKFPIASPMARDYGLTRQVQVINPASRTPARPRPRCRPAEFASPMSLLAPALTGEKQTKRIPHPDSGPQNLFTLS